MSSSDEDMSASGSEDDMAAVTPVKLKSEISKKQSKNVKMKQASEEEEEEDSSEEEEDGSEEEEASPPRKSKKSAKQQSESESDSDNAVSSSGDDFSDEEEYEEEDDFNDFLIPSSFTQASVLPKKSYDSIQGNDDLELWLVKVPYHFDCSLLNGSSLRVGSSLTDCQLQSKDDKFSSQYSVVESDTKESARIVNLFPSSDATGKGKGELRVGKPFTRMLQVIDALHADPEAVLQAAEVERKRKIPRPNKQPKGLVVRYRPIGCDERVLPKLAKAPSSIQKRESTWLENQRSEFRSKKPHIEIKQEKVAKEKEAKKARREARKARKLAQEQARAEKNLASETPAKTEKAEKKGKAVGLDENHSDSEKKKKKKKREREASEVVVVKQEKEEGRLPKEKKKRKREKDNVAEVEGSAKKKRKVREKSDEEGATKGEEKKKKKKKRREE